MYGWLAAAPPCNHWLTSPSTTCCSVGAHPAIIHTQKPRNSSRSSSELRRCCGRSCLSSSVFSVLYRSHRCSSFVHTSSFCCIPPEAQAEVFFTEALCHIHSKSWASIRITSQTDVHSDLWGSECQPEAGSTFKGR